MKTLFVLGCILAIVVPFQARSSESGSKERRYFNRFCPPCPPCGGLPDYPSDPQWPIMWPFYPPPPGPQLAPPAAPPVQG